MKNTIIYTTYLLVVSLFWGTSAYAQWDKFTPSADNIIYVKVNGGFGNDGSSWAKATNSITRALEWAAANNARFSSQTPLKIYVSKGTFVPEGDAFVLVKDVKLYGGFDPDAGITELKHKRKFGDDGTILSGDKKKRHVVISAGDVGKALLDGFSITGGKASKRGDASKNVNGETVFDDRGAGVYSANSSPTLRNVRIYDNEVDEFQYDPEPLPDFYHDESPRASILYNQGGSPQLLNVAIYNNRGIAMANTRNIPIPLYPGGPFESPVFTELDKSPEPKLTNVTIANNKAVAGPAIYNYAGSQVHALNCIVWGNTKPDGTVTDNIYNSNRRGHLPGYDRANEVFYYNSVTQDPISKVKQDSVGPNGTLWTSKSPFTNIRQNNLTLPDNSPAVDFGSNFDYKSHGGDLDNDQDLSGQPRLGCSYIDAGAYENNSKPRGTCLVPDSGPNNSFILYVDQNVKGGNGKGSSWANAVPDLADALKWAWDNNDQRGGDRLLIYVAKGIYYPKYSPEDGLSNPADLAKRRDFTFVIGKNVELYGGFDPANGITDREHPRIVPTRDSPDVGGTILSGDFKDDDKPGSLPTLGAAAISGNTENAYHVVLGAGNVPRQSMVIDGFTITGGNADNNDAIKVAGQMVYRDKGAGLLLQFVRGNSTLRNLSVKSNTSKSDGAGIYLGDEESGYSTSKWELSNSVVSNNKSGGHGGGVFSKLHVTLDNSMVRNNSADKEGAGIAVHSVQHVVASLFVNKSSVAYNAAQGRGGGVSISNSHVNSGGHNKASVIIVHSFVDNNYSKFAGGGVYVSYIKPSDHATNYVTLSHSSVSDNRSDGWGAGIATYFDVFTSTYYTKSYFSRVALSKSMVEGNRSREGGAAIGTHFSYTSDPFQPPLGSPSYNSSVTSSNSTINNNTAGQGSIISSTTTTGLNLLGHLSLTALNTSLIGNKGSQVIGFNSGLKKELKLFNSIVYNNSNLDGTPYKEAGWLSGVNHDNENVSYKNNWLQGDPDPEPENGNLLGVSNPLFVDAAKGNYMLQEESPLRDAGDRSLYDGSSFSHFVDKDLINLLKLDIDFSIDVTNNNDLAGQPRLAGCNIDIGAFENQSNQGEICITPSKDNVVYVNQSVIGGDKSGNSWANAAPNLADALKWTHDNRTRWTAAKPLKMYVAKGTYHPKYSYEDKLADPAAPADNRDKSFLMVENVELYGGFNGRETELSERTLPTDGATGTILSGDFNGDDAVSGSGSTLKISNNSENAYHVVTAVNGEEDIKLLIDGFEITGGNADGEKSISVKSSGGFSSVDPVNGGGIYMATYGAITLDLKNSRVSGNRAADDGGGIYLLPNAPFPGADAPNSTIIFDNAHVVANYSGSSGGGLYHRSYINAASNSKSITSDLTLDRSTVRDNYSASFGGGVYTDAVSNGSGSVDVNTVINHSRIEGNWADNSGGGILVNSSKALSMEANNTEFSANGTKESGAAINVIAPFRTSHNNGITLNNSTVAGNIGKTYINFTGGERVFKVNNSLILANTKTDNTNSILGGTPTKTMQYSLVQGETSTANGNIDATDVTAGDIFTDAAADDYSLKLGAVAIGTGNNDLYRVGDIQTDTDLAGNLRLFGVTIDMGAYEFQQEVAQEITAAAMRKIYGDADSEPGATVDSGKPLTYTMADNSIAEVYQDVNDGKKWKIKVKKAGTVTITASQTGGYGYLPASKDFDLTIAPKPVTVSMRPTAAINKVYDGTAQGVIAASDLSFADDDILDDDEVTLVLSNTAVRYATKAVGTGKSVTLDLSHLTLEGADKANYVIGNTVALKANIGAIIPAALKVTARADTKDYDGVAYSGGNSVDYEGFADGETEALLDGQLRYTGDSQGAIDAGTYSILPRGLSSSNYSITYTPGVLTIDKIELPVFRFEGDTFEYDGSAHSLTAYGLPDGAKVDHYIDNGQTEAGTYTVTAVIDGGINYIDGSQVAKLTITKAALPALTFMDESFVYDGSVKALKVIGLPEGTHVDYTENYQTDAGEYTVTAVIDGGINYIDGAQVAKLTITKAALPALNFMDESFEYDGSVKALKVTGLPEGTRVDYRENGQTEAGTYTVTAVIDGGINYIGGSQVAELTITKAALSALTFMDASFVYDGSVKVLKVTGLPEGTHVDYRENGQTEAGTYMVTAIIDGGNNYVGTTKTAVLKINKAKQTISFSAPEILGRDAGTVPLDARSSVSLPIHLAVDDPSVATVSGTDLQVHRLGTVRVTATQAGDHNHEAATAVTVIVRVAAEATAKVPIIVHKALSPNGDGINDFLTIEGLGDYPDNKVTIFDKNGSVLAEIDGYNNRDKVFTGNDCRDDTYFYYLDLKDKGVWKREKGYFVIRR